MKYNAKTVCNAASKTAIFGASLLLSGIVASPASAQNAGNDFSLTGNVAFVSDYRFRGLSLSDKDFAIQGGLNLNHNNGFYAGVWGSSIEQSAGAESELDLFVGYNGSLGNLSTNIGVIAYIYPGSDNTTYYEVFGSISGTANNIFWTLGSAYAWDQSNIGSQDNIYFYLSSSAPLGKTGVSINGTIGFEDGAFGNDKWDWNAGFSYSFKKITLAVSYVDSNTGAGNGSAGVMASLSASF